MKPANIMIGLDGVVKILDFGIARVTDSGLTQAGVMMGTPNYMSPEQVEGKEVDRRSDIFAVGLVLYELLAYQQAFAGETAHVVMNAIVRKPPAPLAAACPGPGSGDRAHRHSCAAEGSGEAISDAGADGGGHREGEGAGGRRAQQPDRRPGDGHDADAASNAFVETHHAPPGTNRDVLAKKRLERIESHLVDAQRAFDSQDYPAALECCEQAALLDPDDVRVLELLERTREALDGQKIAALVAEAQAALLRDDVEHASRLVAQALQIDTNSPEARAVEGEIADLETRRRDAEQQQAAIAAAMTRARTALAEGNFQAAIRCRRRSADSRSGQPRGTRAHEPGIRRA